MRTFTDKDLLRTKDIKGMKNEDRLEQESFLGIHVEIFKDLE